MRLPTRFILAVIITLWLGVVSVYPGGYVQASCNVDIPPGYSGVDCPTHPIFDVENLDPDWARLCNECLGNVGGDATNTSWVNPPGTAIPTYDTTKQWATWVVVEATATARSATRTAEFVASVTATLDDHTQVPTKTVDVTGTTTPTATPTLTQTATITPTATNTLTPSATSTLQQYWLTDTQTEQVIHYFPSSGMYYQLWSINYPEGTRAGMCVLTTQSGGVQYGFNYVQNSNEKASMFWLQDVDYNYVNNGQANITRAELEAACFGMSMGYIGGNNQLWLTSNPYYHVMNGYGGNTQTLNMSVRFLMRGTGPTATPTQNFTATAAYTQTLTATAAYSITATAAYSMTATAEYHQTETAAVTFTQYPTYTPLPTYTSAVLPRLDCTTPEYVDTDPVVEWDGLIYWGSSCDTVFPHWEYSLPEIGGFPGYDIEVPEIAVCVNWYTPPEFTLAGITIPVVPIIAAPVIAWLIRSFLRM